mmetsp:Transcript_20693/g.65246  ORF Transcript_20693/g.65246 Transcript_20693/m.65246 type:complete len:360 (-) Transcript_20693:155-1234(-)
MPEKRAREADAENGGDGCIHRAKAQQAGSVEVLDREAFTARTKAARLRRNPTGPLMDAMYSSLVDGIVTDPDLMLVPLDDHAFIRGHAVFDTATLARGRVYRLGIHLDRLFASAKDARLQLPFGPSEEQNRARITEIVCRTCVASGRRDGAVRMFLSGGPGNFGFTSAGCEPAFYCVVYGGMAFAFAPIDEVTVRTVPMKPPLLARMKTNNYMLNVLTAMDAQDRGGKFGILVRGDDTVAEGCVANCAVVTAERELITPTFGDVLAGTTVRKAMELAKRHLVGEGRPLKEVRQEVLSLATARAAVEVMMLGGDTHVCPVRKLDGKLVGDGKPGPVTTELFRLLTEEAQQGCDEHIELKY